MTSGSNFYYRSYSIIYAKITLVEHSIALVLVGSGAQSTARGVRHVGGLGGGVKVSYL